MQGPSITENKAATAAAVPAIVEKGKPHRWKPGQSGNPRGRVSVRTAKAENAEAKTWARLRVDRVLERLDIHLNRCPASKDCAMCRHYNLLVMEYAYGKPPQRHELIQATAKADVLKLAKELGMTEAETKDALAEVDRALAAARSSQRS